MVADEGLPAVIVNPSTPIGPRDIKPTPTGRVIVEAASGRMPGLRRYRPQSRPCRRRRRRPSRGHGQGPHRRALHSRRPGRAVRPVSGGNRRAGGPQARRASEFPARRCFRWPRRAVARFTGKEPFVTMDALKHGEIPHVLLLGQGRAELGYSARPYTRALDDALDWFRQMGYWHGQVIWARASGPCDLALSAFRARPVLADRERETRPACRTRQLARRLAVVPARNEADVIARSLGACWRRIIPARSVSCWWTTRAPTAPARSRARAGQRKAHGATGAPCPPGWTGKLWALSPGRALRARELAPNICCSPTPNPAHPGNLRALVARRRPAATGWCR